MGALELRRRILLDSAPSIHYTPLQYIGTISETHPYIDMGIALTDELEFEIRCYNTKKEVFLYGARKNVSTVPYNNINFLSDQDKMRLDYGNVRGDRKLINGKTGEMLLTFKDRIFTVTNFTTDIVTNQNYSEATFRAYPEQTMALFAAYTNSVPSLGGGNGVLNIYYAKFWLGSQLVRDFIPCLYNEVAGMYDKVSKRFFASENEDTFTPGPQ